MKKWNAKSNGSNSCYYTIYNGDEAVAQKINGKKRAIAMAATPLLLGALKAALVEMKFQLREIEHDLSVGIDATSLICAIQNAEQAIIKAEGN